jgi:hypothetical protein
MQNMSIEETLEISGGGFWSGLACGAGIAGILLTEGAISPVVGVGTLGACGDAIFG